jgi:hypothetical protein
MNRIKNIAFSILFSMLAFSAITYTACNKDECKDVVCQNGGTCVSGTCACPTGYEGTTCQTESRSKFLKQYTVTASCQATYVATITAASGTDVTKVTITNFANLNAAAGTTTSVYGNVNGNIITIPTQNAVGFSSANISVSGSGTFENGVITFTYSVVSGGTTNTCTNTNWQ